jgi:hypothetical protein
MLGATVVPEAVRWTVGMLGETVLRGEVAVGGGHAWRDSVAGAVAVGGGGGGGGGGDAVYGSIARGGGGWRANRLMMTALAGLMEVR